MNDTCDHCEKPGKWEVEGVTFCDQCLVDHHHQPTICQCCKIDAATRWAWQLHLCDDCYGVKLEQRGETSPNSKPAGCTACGRKTKPKPKPETADV